MRMSMIGRGGLFLNSPGGGGKGGRGEASCLVKGREGVKERPFIDRS